MMHYDHNCYSYFYSILENLCPEDACARIQNISLNTFATSKVVEFISIALLHRADRDIKLRDSLSEQLKRMQPFWHERHESMNFRLMRVVLEKRLDNRLVKVDDLDTIGLHQLSDGSLPDGREGISSQYHAYMLLLLLRWGDRQDCKLHQIIEKSFAWLHDIWRRFDDPNPLGRGRFQIFGYASMAKACELAQEWGYAQPSGFVEHIHENLIPEEPEGALSIRWSGPFRDALLHGYNNPDDYSAFAKFWINDIVTRLRTKINTSKLFRHILDFQGSSLIANVNGPMWAIVPNPIQPPLDIGKKQKAIKALRTLLQKQRYAENSQPEILHTNSFEIEGAKFSCDAQSLVMRTPFSPCYHSKTIWIRGTPSVPKITGTTENSEWQWSRPGQPRWYGYSFRIFGEAEVEWTL